MRAAVEVKTIDEAARARALAVQTLAFSADPMVRYTYPEPGAFLEHFPAFADAFGGRALEHASAFEAGGFAGVAFWLPPGIEADGDAIAGHLFSTTDPTLRDEVNAIFEQMGAFHIHEPHWYLPMIGVDPARQGQGLGSALLAHALRRCDAEHLPAYLESSNPANVPLYERHGFRVIGQIQAGGSPTLYPMLRDAR